MWTINVLYFVVFKSAAEAGLLPECCAQVTVSVGPETYTWRWVLFMTWIVGIVGDINFNM